jgi:hypothetical protein
VGDRDDKDEVSRREAGIQESYHRAFATSTHRVSKRGRFRLAAKPTNVKLYPSGYGKTASWSWSVRFEQMPPEDAPRLVAYPRCEHGTGFVDVQV